MENMRARVILSHFESTYLANTMGFFFSSLFLERLNCKWIHNVVEDNFIGICHII